MWPLIHSDTCLFQSFCLRFPAVFGIIVFLHKSILHKLELCRVCSLPRSHGTKTSPNHQLSTTEFNITYGYGFYFSNLALSIVENYFIFSSAQRTLLLNPYGTFKCSFANLYYVAILCFKKWQHSPGILRETAPVLSLACLVINLHF